MSGIQITFILWIVISIVIGYFASRRTKKIEQFWVTERNITPAIYGISIVSTALTPVVFVGLAGLMGNYGYGAIYWICIPQLIAFAIMLCIIAPKMRRVNKAVSVSDFLADRYDSDQIRTLTAILVMIFGILYATQIVMGTSVVVTYLFDIPWIASCVVVTIGALVYTVLGGMLGIIWNSVQQWIVFFLGSFIMMPAILSKAGGLQNIVKTISTTKPGFFSLFGPNPQLLTLPVILGFLVTFIFGNVLFNPATLTRHFVTKNEKTPVRASYIVTGSIAFIWVFVILIFLGGMVLYPNPEDLESLFVLLAKNEVAAWSGAIALFGIVATGLSTIGVDYMLFSQSVVNDILVKTYHRDLTSEKQTQLARIWLVIGAVIALVISMFRPALVMIVLQTAAEFSMVFTGPVIGAFWWKRATREATFWSMLVGAIMVVCSHVWQIVSPNTYSPWFGPGLTGFWVSGLLFIIISLVTKPTSHQLEVYEEWRTK